jgi:WD40 repeat protein
MFFNRLHWLEIAEYVSLGLAAISLLLALIWGWAISALIFFWIALLLNLINRLRCQHLSRRRLDRAIKQLQRQVAEEITASQTPEVSPAPLSLSKSETQGLTRLQGDLLNLEKSLNGVVQYLNHADLLQRLQQLERAFAQLQPETLPLPAPNPETETPSAPASKLENPTAESPPPPQSSLTLPQIPTQESGDRGETGGIPPTFSWTCLHTLSEHREAVAALTISPDSQLLASVSWDQTLKLWDLATGKLRTTQIAHSQGLLTVAFTSYGQPSRYCDLATGSFDQTIKLWSLSRDKSDQIALNLEKTLTAHTGSVHSLTLAPQQQILLSGSYDQTLKQWEMEAGEMLCSSYDSLGAIYALAVAEASEVIASGGGDGQISLWRLGRGEKLGLLSGNISSVVSLAFSPDGQTLAAGCVDGTIKLWQLNLNSLASGRKSPPIRIFSAHAGQVHSLIFSGDGQALFSSGADGKIKIWHPSSRQPVTVLNFSDDSQQRPPSVTSLSLSADGQFLVAGGVDGLIRIWQQH